MFPPKSKSSIHHILRSAAAGHVSTIQLLLSSLPPPPPLLAPAAHPNDCSQSSSAPIRAYDLFVAATCGSASTEVMQPRFIHQPPNYYNFSHIVRPLPVMFSSRTPTAIGLPSISAWCNSTPLPLNSSWSTELTLQYALGLR